MGCSASTLAEDSQAYSKQRMMSEAIDRLLLLSLEAEHKQTRMFLLGAGESGKSTVLKQMRLLHKNTFSDFERRQYAEVIWLGLVEAMKTLLLNARKFHIPLACDQPGSPLEPHKRVIWRTRNAATDHDPLVGDFDFGLRAPPQTFDTAHLLSDSWRDDAFDMSSLGALQGLQGGSQRPLALGTPPSRDQIARAVEALWAQDPGVRRSLAQSHRFQMELLAAYYFDNVHKFKDTTYRCSDEDILRGRIKTTGITENSFPIRNGVLKVLDAGGQRSERKKWIHCFQDIDVVLFVLAVLEYDQTLYEDTRVNRMHESFALFEALCNSRWFHKTPFILFLNKVDLLEEKLPRLPITNYFPDYDRDPNSVGDVLDYMEAALLRLNKSKKPLYVHRTCATDTAGMSFVLSAVTDMIIQQNLKESGIM